MNSTVSPSTRQSQKKGFGGIRVQLLDWRPASSLPAFLRTACWILPSLMLALLARTSIMIYSGHYSIWFYSISVYMPIYFNCMGCVERDLYCSNIAPAFNALIIQGMLISTLWITHFHDAHCYMLASQCIVSRCVISSFMPIFGFCKSQEDFENHLLSFDWHYEWPFT